MQGLARDPGHGHVVEFYESDRVLIPAVTGFVGSALVAGDGAVIVAGADHIRAILASLEQAGAAPTAAAREGRFAAVDAAPMLAGIGADGSLDAGVFRDTVASPVERMLTAGLPVRIYAEIVALLWSAGHAAGAMAAERLCQQLAQVAGTSVLCGFPMRTAAAIDPAQLPQPCEERTATVPPEDYFLLDGSEQRLSVAILHQQLLSARAEIALLRERHQALERLAYADPLTGLGNRRAFLRDVEREWGLAARHGEHCYVIVADLDGFKEYNDRCGHAAGDVALQQFAGALVCTTRSTDVVGRLGGDEFGILLVRCEEHGVERFAAALGQELDSRAPAAPGGYQLSASLGWAPLQPPQPIAESIRRADLDMLANKRARRAGRPSGAPQ